MTTIWIMSDPHFGHAKMLQFKRNDGSPLRDFPNVDAMDEYLIDRINSVVQDNHHLYMLGDIAIRKEHIKKVARCRGHKRWVPGNHDIFAIKEYLPFFEKVMGYRIFDDMILSHIPLHPESVKPRWSVNVHGHLHHQNPFLLGPKYFNVSAEMLPDYTPLSLEQIREHVKNGTRPTA